MGQPAKSSLMSGFKDGGGVIVPAGTLPSDKLPIFFLKPNFTSRHACLEVKITRVYDMID
jgi:hypothetical protein